MKYESWGRIQSRHRDVKHIYWMNDVVFNGGADATYLPFGMGRSYGDSCLNDGGVLIDTTGLNRLIHFDAQKGILRCEAGATFEDILNVIVPRGYFLPVVPGTKHITVGGGIANDIHGKNHHCAGTFGRYVRQFELERSDGSRMICSPEKNKEMYGATIGGLGLTGLILWAEIQLKPIKNSYIEMESIKFKDLDGFLKLSEESNQNFEYTVAWVDCLSKGKEFGRGIFIRGNHSSRGEELERKRKIQAKLAVPFDFPSFILNPAAIRCFNSSYYAKQKEKIVKNRVHYDSFFFPLDGIRHWNRLYGKSGFFQHQSVLPREAGMVLLEEMMRMIVDSGQGSFLAVLKVFGDLPSPGLLSFPRPGITLALDFAHAGEKTRVLLDRMDHVIEKCQGAVYPAKDARLSKEKFQAFFEKNQEFEKYKDRKFQSNFWKRIHKETPASFA